MSSLIVIGDLHISEKQPFYNVSKEFFNWLYNQEFNNKDNYLLQLGDLFHNNHPSPKEYSLFLDCWINNCKFQKGFFLAGNHDYKRIKDLYSIEGISAIKNIECVFNYEILQLNNVKMLLLPWYYGLSKKYELSKETEDQEYDYIFGHFSNEELFGEKINIDNLKGKKILGHIHIRKNDFLGTPYITRYDEKGQQGKIIKINLITKEIEYIDIPKLIDYVEIDYPNDLIFNNDYKIPYFEINNCENKEIVKQYYLDKYKDKKIYFYKFNKKQEKNKNSSNDRIKSNKKISINDFFIKFCEKNNINENIKNKLLGILNE